MTVFRTAGVMADERRAAVAALALPALLCLLCVLIARRGTAGTFAAQYLLYAPAMWGLWALTGRAWSAWLAGFFPLLLTLIDYYKLAINGAPLELSDFSLAGQLGEVAGFALPQLRFPAGIVAALALYAAVFAALIVRRRALTPPRGRARALTMLCGASVFALLLFSSLGAALAEAVMRAPAAEGAAVPRLLRAYHARSEADAPPPDFDWEAVEALPETPPEEPEEPETPTVIFLMSESFFDCTELPNVAFEDDPLPNFHALRRTSRHGKFLSNTYAGGTGYVEMEVLTGLCNALLREGDNLCSLPEEAYRTIPCIADVFGSYGYEKIFLHSYNDALYNRRVIYDAFGFDAVRFEEDFPEDAERKGGYISDLALAREIISCYERSEGPAMIFAVSMENHQPYYAEKFGAENDVALASDALDEQGLAALRAYVYGARDADAALGYLVDYFTGVDEPVMLVFWGDHLPNLSLPDGSIYEKLGCVPTSVTIDWPPEALEKMLSTDYVIWRNDETDASEGRESNTLFGLRVLERLGFRLSGYYAWLAKDVEPFYGMYRPRLFADAGGAAYAEIPERYAAAMERYRAAVRDAAYNGGQIFQTRRQAIDS